jgi:hypothetical protein
LEKIKWYQERWNIEVYFKILKSGFGLDKSRLRHFDRIKKFSAFVSIIAWRIFWLTKVSRSAPELPYNIAFNKKEKEAIIKLNISDGKSPPSCKNLSECVSAIARLGGYLNRKSDPPPGSIVLWRGMQRLLDAVAILD